MVDCFGIAGWLCVSFVCVCVCVRVCLFRLQIEVQRSSAPMVIFLLSVLGTIALLLKFAMDKVMAVINTVLASTRLWMAVCVVRDLVVCVFVL
jgi:hypothetical protein